MQPTCPTTLMAMVSVMHLTTTKTATVLPTLLNSANLSEPMRVMQTQTAMAYVTDQKHRPTVAVLLDLTPSRLTQPVRLIQTMTECLMNCWEPPPATRRWPRTWTMTTTPGRTTWNCSAAPTQSRSWMSQPIRMEMAPVMRLTTTLTYRSHSTTRHNTLTSL